MAGGPEDVLSENECERWRWQNDHRAGVQETLQKLGDITEAKTFARSEVRFPGKFFDEVIPPSLYSFA